MNKVKIDYDNVSCQLGALEAAVNECDLLVRELNRLIPVIISSWEGDSRDAFMEVLEKRIRDIRILSQNTQDVMNTISHVTSEFKKAEKRIALDITFI